eukprot:1176622-Prorocentrum_minimum.AAC.2
MGVGGITAGGGAGGAVPTCCCGHTRMRRGAAAAPLLRGAVVAPPHLVVGSQDIGMASGLPWRASHRPVWPIDGGCGRPSFRGARRPEGLQPLSPEEDPRH